MGLLLVWLGLRMTSRVSKRHETHDIPTLYNEYQHVKRMCIAIWTLSVLYSCNSNSGDVAENQ